MNQSTQPSSSAPKKAASGINMEIVIALLVSLIAIAAIIGSRGFPGTGLSTDIGSARFPLIHSVALLVLSAILVIQNLRKRKPADTPHFSCEAPAPS